MNFSRRLKSQRRSSVLASCGTAIALFPIAVWAHDSLFSLCRVRGSSMEPALFDGDVVVVRKSDGFWQRFTRPIGNDSQGRQADRHKHQRWAAERERVLSYEREHCNSNGSIGLLRKPATPITGDIVVFKDPEKYPDRWNIKRVVALGGQIARASVLVPPFCIWVEGDNLANSTDSRTKSHGPVSKKLLVGIVEYRVWPPWRFGELENSNSTAITNTDSSMIRNNDAS